MDHLHMIRVFVAVVEAESLAGAARELLLSPSAVTRAMAALEHRLGVRLLNRTTRHLRITQAGQKYYEDVKKVLALSADADSAVMGLNKEPQGKLTITAPVLFGRLFVMPVIVDFLDKYPKVEINAQFVDRIVNMLDEGVDLAVRIAELPDSTYMAIKVGCVRRVLCASPKYLAKYGRPEVPEDLIKHKVILARGVTPVNEIRFLKSEKSITVKVQPSLSVNDNTAAIHAAIAGLGITRLLNYQIADAIKAGTLEIILKEYEINAVPVHVLHRESRNSSNKIRIFVDLLSEYLKNTLISIE